MILPAGLPADITNPRHGYPTKGKPMHIYNSLEEAKDLVTKAQAAMGLPIDDSGVRKLLVSLRALGLTDWIEPKAVEPDKDAEARRVKL